MAQKDEHTTIAAMVDKSMQEKGLGIREVAEAMDLTYEHVRRIVRGEAVPSKLVLKPLCALLELSYPEADSVATGERIRKKYGVIDQFMTPRVKGMEQIEKVWPMLTEAQQKDALSLIQGWAKNNHAKVSK